MTCEYITENALYASMFPVRLEDGIWSVRRLRQGKHNVLASFVKSIDTSSEKTLITWRNGEVTSLWLKSAEITKISDVAKLTIKHRLRS